MEAAAKLASTLSALHLADFQATSFEPDPKVIQFEYSAKEDIVCEGVKVQVSTGIAPTAPLASLKRNSLASLGGFTKKRRGSKASLLGSPYLDTSGQSQLSSIADPNFIQYHQMSQRRHSYAPLSTYQEQQFQWLDPLPNNQNLFQMQMPGNMMMLQPPRLSMDYTPAVRSKLGNTDELPKSAGSSQPFMFNQMPFDQLNTLNFMQPNGYQDPELFQDSIPNQSTSFIDTSQSQSFMDNSWQWQQQQ
jgi:hypothetical protein